MASKSICYNASTRRVISIQETSHTWSDIECGDVSGDNISMKCVTLDITSGNEDSHADVGLFVDDATTPTAVQLG